MALVPAVACPVRDIGGGCDQLTLALGAHQLRRARRPYNSGRRRTEPRCLSGPANPSDHLECMGIAGSVGLHGMARDTPFGAGRAGRIAHSGNRRPECRRLKAGYQSSPRHSALLIWYWRYRGTRPSESPGSLHSRATRPPSSVPARQSPPVTASPSPGQPRARRDPRRR